MPILAATATAAQPRDVAPVPPVVIVRLEDNTLAAVAATDLQPTKGLRATIEAPASPEVLRFCAHFVRDGVCKRRHRRRVAHYDAPVAVSNDDGLARP